jgi:hypothetical protein
LPGPKGRPWGDTTIRGHQFRGTGILRNELYTGRLVWNRLRYSKDPNTGKRVSRLNPPELWVRQEVPELRIVDDELWMAAQQRLGAIRSSPGVTTTRAHKFWEHRRNKHLLTGLARCGICGSPLAAAGRDYLACSAARRQGSCQNRKGIRRRILEDLVLNGMRDRMMAPDLVAEFIDAFDAEIKRATANAGSQQARLRHELAGVEDKLAGTYRRDKLWFARGRAPSKARRA